MSLDYVPPDNAGVFTVLSDFPGFFYELRGFWDGDPQFRYMSSTRYITGHDVSHWPADFAAAAEFIHDDDLRIYKDLGIRARRGDEDLAAAYRERSVHGDYRWVREVAAPGVDLSGATTLSGFCVDMTAVRAFDAGLVERERRLRAALESSSSQIVEFDAAGRLAHVSGDAVNGYPPTTVGPGRLGWLAGIVDRDRDCVEAVLGDAFDRRTGCEVVFHVAHRDGSYRTARLRITYFAGELGPPGWIGVVADITEPARLAQRARFADTRTRAIERRTDASVYYWRDGAATFDTGGLQVRLDIHRSDVGEFNAAHQGVVGARAARDIDFRWRRRAADDWRWVRASVWSLGDGRAAIGVFLPDDDIVDRERERARIDGALTGRERETLRRFADGSSNRQLALAMHLSETTVSHHVANVLKKLNLANRTAAAALAARLERGS